MFIVNFGRGITTKGWYVYLSGISLIIVALIMGENALIPLALIVLFLPCAAATLAMINKPHLNIVYSTSSLYAQQGSWVTINIEYVNKKSRPIGNFIALWEFTGISQARGNTQVPGIAGRSRKKTQYRLRTSRRGVFTLPQIHIKITEPMGLFELTIAPAITSPIPAVIVYPAIVDLLPTETVGESNHGHNISTLVSPHMALHDQDINSLRPYIQGDDLRMVHWKSSAHAQKLIVRHYEQLVNSSTNIVLDTRVSTASYSAQKQIQFEWILSAAASFALALSENNHPTELYIYRNSTNITSISLSPNQRYNLFSQLAHITPYESTESLNISHFNVLHSGNTIIFSNSLNDKDSLAHASIPANKKRWIVAGDILTRPTRKNAERYNWTVIRPQIFNPILPEGKKSLYLLWQQIFNNYLPTRMSNYSPNNYSPTDPRYK